MGLYVWTARRPDQFTEMLAPRPYGVMDDDFARHRVLALLPQTGLTPRVPAADVPEI